MAKPRLAETYRGYRRNHEPDKRRSGMAQKLKAFKAYLEFDKAIVWSKRAVQQYAAALDGDKLNSAFTLPQNDACESVTRCA